MYRNPVVTLLISALYFRRINCLINKPLKPKYSTLCVAANNQFGALKENNDFNIEQQIFCNRELNGEQLQVLFSTNNKCKQ